jgi:hypothetical protein
LNIFDRHRAVGLAIDFHSAAHPLTVEQVWGVKG